MGLLNRFRSLEEILFKKLLATISLAAAASGPRVNLLHATYEETSFSNGVSQFLGMQYAASLVGAS